MTTLDFWLGQQTKRLEQNAEQARLDLRRATGMREVVAATRISIPVELRGTAQHHPSVRAIHRAAEQKLEALLEAHVAMLRATHDAVACKTLLLRYQQTEWIFLRGAYPRLASKAAAAGREVIASLAKDR